MTGFLEFKECHGCGELFPIRSPLARSAKWCSERCRKAQYAGTCVDCGAPTNGYNGRAKAGKRCAICQAAYKYANRYWTPERIVHAIKASAKESGRAPTAGEWLYARPEGAPSVNTVQRVFGSWNAAIDAAGFTPRGAADRLHYHNQHTSPTVPA